MTTSKTISTTRLLGAVSLAAVLAAFPVTLKLDGFGAAGLRLSSALAKDGGKGGSGKSGGGDDHGGRGSGDDHGGSTAGGDDNGGGDHGGHGGGDAAGDDHGGHGGDDAAGDDHGADDAAGDNHGGRGRGGDDKAAGHHADKATGAKVEIAGNDIEVRFPNGWKEEIENGIYEMKDPAGRTVAERPATSADVARLTAIAR